MKRSMMSNNRSLRLRIATVPALAGLSALALVTVVPHAASADPAGSPSALTSSSAVPLGSASASSSAASPSGAVGAASSAAGSVVGSALAAATTASSSSTASSTASPTTTTGAATGAGAATGTTAPTQTGVRGPLTYSCMLLGEKVPMAVTYSVPKSLVTASRAIFPAGRTLAATVGAPVTMHVSVRLSAKIVSRLKLVDMKKIGGKLATQAMISAQPHNTTYSVPVRTLRAAKDGSQTVTATVKIGGILVSGRGTTVVTEPIAASRRIRTGLFIANFPQSQCNLIPTSAVRTVLTIRVAPASITTKVDQTHVAATVRDGARALASGTVTMVLSGPVKGKTVTKAITGKLSKGVYAHSFRRQMTGLGMTSGTVTVKFAGATKTVRVHV